MLVTRASRIALPPHATSTGLVIVPVLWSVLVATALMAPRILSPQLGLFDDGVTLKVAASMTTDWSGPIEVMRSSGRFMPGYWLFYGVRHAIFGDGPLWLFMSNWIVLILSVVCLARFVHLASGSARAAGLSGLLFVMSGPVIENFYTLSKSEVPQTLWLAASLWLVASVDRVRTQGATTARHSGLLFVCILMLLLTKETSVVLVLIGGAWLVLDRLLNRRQGVETHSRGALVFFLSSVASAGIFLGLRSYFVLPALSQGGYTSAYRLDVASILSSFERWVLFGSRDFLYLVPLLVPALLWLRRAGERPRRVVWNMALWMGGWMAIFLPWPSVLEYHLLPFSLGVCAIGGVLLGGLLERATAADAPLLERRLSQAGLAAALLCVGITVVNNASNARVQLAVDAANATLVDYLATLPQDSAILVDLPDPNEYVYELRLQLHEMKARPDLAVAHLTPASPEPRPSAPRTYYVSPWMQNQPVPSVRLAFSEDGTREWRTSLARKLPPAPAPLADITESSRLLDVDVHKAACEAVERVVEQHLCSSRRSVLERRTLVYGWRVYESP